MEKEEEKGKLSIVKRLLKRKKLLAVVLVLVVAIVIWRSVVSRKNGDFESTQVLRGTVSEELVLTGEIKADEHASLKFPYSGKIAWVGVSEGDSVEKGQQLMKLDTASLSQDLKIADANLRAKAASLDTVYDDLKDKQDTEDFSEIETRTTAETNKDITVFSHIKTQITLADATLKAPFSGIVSNISSPFSGVSVLFSEPQVELVNPETVYFEVSADQSEVVDLHEGQKVNIVLDSFLEDRFEGMIDFISFSPKAGEVGTVYVIKVKMVGKEFDLTKIRLGMTGDAKFVLSEKSNAMYVPPKFVNSDTDGKYVQKDKNNNKVYVDIGLEGEERVEIISDEIEEGDMIFD